MKRSLRHKRISGDCRGAATAAAVLAGVLLVSIFMPGCRESIERPSGEEWEPMTLYPRIDGHPAWSPDGSTIVYYHHGVTEVNRDGSTVIDQDLEGIWFVDTDGSNQRLFLNGAMDPDWSPDGEMLTFSGVADGQIYTIRADGTGLAKLTETGRNLQPDWSPDGESIAYISDCGTDHGYLLRIMGSDGDNKRNLGFHGFGPDWGPYSLYLIYENEDDEIWRVRVSTMTRRPISQFHAYCEDPASSPDGIRILVTSYSRYVGIQPGFKQIFVLDADVDDPVQLTAYGGEQPCWSPEGTRVAYVCYRPQEYTSEHGTIWIMNEDGSDKRQITVSPVQD